MCGPHMLMVCIELSVHNLTHLLYSKLLNVYWFKHRPSTTKSTHTPESRQQRHCCAQHAQKSPMPAVLYLQLQHLAAALVSCLWSAHPSQRHTAAHTSLPACQAQIGLPAAAPRVLWLLQRQPLHLVSSLLLRRLQHRLLLYFLLQGLPQVLGCCIPLAAEPVHLECCLGALAFCLQAGPALWCWQWALGWIACV